MKLNIQKLEEDAVIPARAHADDAGFDLYAAMSYDVRPGDRLQVKTGIAMAIPESHVGLIWDKSGLSHKAGLKVLGGVVDAGYRGEVLVGLTNLGKGVHRIDRGDKVAQMIIQKYETPEIVLVDSLDGTDRGEGGFGSTGR